MSVSFLNWGLSLIFGGLLARAIARRKDLPVDYRALGAAAFMGLGAVWALGLSSSAAQLQATAASLPPALLKITGHPGLRHHDLHLAVAADAGHPDRADRRDRALLRAPGRRRSDRRGPGRRPGRRAERGRAALPAGRMARIQPDPADPGRPADAGLAGLAVPDQAVPDRRQQPQRLPAGLPHPGPGAARHAAELPAGRRQGRPGHRRHPGPVPALRRDGRDPHQGHGQRRHDRLRRTWRSSSRTSAAAAASPSSSRSTRPCWASWSPPAAANGWSRRPT